ncbi:hypothetical protein JCM10450v2_004552 [Rhodotorula kratochvilovae]
MSGFAQALANMLPYKVPMIYYNESSAAVKLLNCQRVGTLSCSVLPQFDGSRGGNRTHLDAEEYERYSRTVLDVNKKLNSDPKLRGMGWMLLYSWEPHSGYAKHDSDWANVVFGDSTLSRFLLIDLRGSTACPCCDGPSWEYAEGFEAMLELTANRFFNLVSYLGPNKPQWVRATFTTVENPDVNQAFFDFKSGSIPCPNPSSPARMPPIYHIDAVSMKPAFTPADLHALDATALNCDSKISPAEKRSQVLAPPDKYGSLRWMTKTAPNSVTAKMTEVRRACEGCSKFGEMSKRLRCSRCKLSFYCSPACQKADWPKYKANCPTVPK